MFLSNKTINEYLENRKIQIIGETVVESAGIRINLSDRLLIPLPNQIADTQNPIKFEYVTHNLHESPYTMKPGDFVLASTQQRVKTDKDILTMIDGRSTFARIGMTIHVTAGILDGLPFNYENSVLEIKNLGNFDIVLHEGEYVGSYIFAKLSAPIEGEKVSPYTNQNGVTPPKI